MKENFGEDYEGVLIHDCYSAQNNTVAKSGHQQCFAHIYRDLKYLIQTYQSKWAYELYRFLYKAQKAQDFIYWKDCNVSKEKLIQSYQNQLKTFLVRNSCNKEVLRLQKRFFKGLKKNN